MLHTSGVDGVYPAGLPVARVTAVDRQAEGAFARIALAPVAAVDGVRHVLVLEPLRVQLPPPPAAEPASAPRAPVRSRR
jgi:rod shape-determining protein MreC